MVESYFRAQNPNMSTYWIGLRQPSLGNGTYNRLAFAWEDGMPTPALNPSGKDFEGAGYSHYGLNIAGVYGEPNNGNDANEQCIAAHAGSITFSYYSGPFTAPGRAKIASYIQEANSSRNLWSW
jgi:hypothetical protein